jgi:hypothetical protein
MNIFLVFFHKGNQAFSIFKYKQIMILASKKTQKKKRLCLSGYFSAIKKARETLSSDQICSSVALLDAQSCSLSHGATHVDIS